MVMDCLPDKMLRAKLNSNFRQATNCHIWDMSIPKEWPVLNWMHCIFVWLIWHIWYLVHIHWNSKGDYSHEAIKGKSIQAWINESRRQLKVSLGGRINGLVFILLSVSLNTLNSNVLLLLKNGLKLTELDAMQCALMGTDTVTPAFSPSYFLSHS